MKKLNRRANRMSTFLPWIGWVLLASVFIWASFGVRIDARPAKSARTLASEPTVALTWNH